MSIKLSLAVSKDKIFRECGKLTLPKSFDYMYQLNPKDKVFCVLDINPSRMYTLEWGLVPHWANRLTNRGNLVTIDIENISSKPSSRIPFRSKRGYVLVDAVYHIHKKGLDYTPYRIERKDGQLMRLACLWEEWRQGDQYLSSTAIITRKTNNFIADNFPVEFNQQETEQWFTESSLDKAERMLHKTFRPELYQVNRVTDRLLEADYNEQDLTVPIPEEINLFSNFNS